MPSVASVTPIRWTNEPLDALDVDLVIIPWFDEDAPSALGDLNVAAGGEIARALASKEFVPRAFEWFLTTVVHERWRPRRIALIGAGALAAYDGELTRKIASTAGSIVRQRRVGKAAFVLRGQGDLAELAQAAAEGLTLSEFNAGVYKTSDPPPAAPPTWTIATADTPSAAERRLADAVSRGRLLGDCSNLAREMANEPSNTLTPTEFALRATRVASEAGVGVEILDERRIAELKMGLLLGVARGSAEPPRLMVFRHDPPGAPDGPVLGLVGKGITFDTGGISLKEAAGMERMKDDMAGGAAVACAMRAIAMLEAPVRVIGVVPATENMPGGRAVKPGDVLRSAEGKTVEVLNTDAEGRLILGDALWYARRLGATHLVDIATLTGACVVALGKTTSGLFGTPPSWVEQVRRVALREGDRVWPMPVFDDYREQLKSDIADFSNTGGRPAGSITAAIFLKEFSGGLPWAHIDIAGTAWAEEAKPYLPKGPSGVGVRTLAELAFTSSEWRF
jgi:leucyl aminopeptidase